MKKYAIYVTLLIAVAARLYGINSPIVGHHSWRQADTAGVARNYYENGYDFLYPQIDWRGDMPGYYEGEFPIYQFITALCYKAFGFSELWGRFLSLIFSIITILYVYKLVRKLIDESTALWSSFFLAVFPLYIFYSRAVMVESMLIMCMVMGIYFFSEWLSWGKKIYFIVSSIFIALAALIKLYAFFIGLPLLYLAWLKYERQVLLKKSLWLFCLLVVAPTALWYYHAHQNYLQYGLTVGIWDYGTDKWGTWGLIITAEFWRQVLLEWFAKSHLTWAGFAVFLVGLFLKRKSEREKLFDFWLLAVIVYIIIVGRGNYVHDYYQLPIVVPASIYAGKVYARYFDLTRLRSINTIILAVCLLAIVILAENRYYHLIKSEYDRDKTTDRLNLAEAIKQIVEEDALIVTFDKDNSTILYLSHRKGWKTDANKVSRKFLNEVRSKGARYLVGFTSHFQTASQTQDLNTYLHTYEVLFNNERVFILRL